MGMTYSRDDIIQILREIKDPELGIDIWTLGLIYDLVVSETGDVFIKMTYTTPLCPFGKELTNEMKERIVLDIAPPTLKIEVVFDPPWEPTEELRAMLGV